MSSSSTTTEPTVRETPEVSGDDNANARAAVHSANKPGAAYAAAVANGESERAWIRRVVLLLTGQAFSLLGSNIVQYAIWWWIVLQTKTGSAMLLATLFGVVPQAIVSICGGSWADRHSRKLLIMLPDMVIAVVTVVLSLSFAMGWASLTMIFVVLFIRSAGGGVQTPAVQSFIPDVVPSGKLLRVNSIYGVINSVNMIVAPAVAAVLINTVPLWSILLVDVTTAIIGVGFVALIKAPKKSTEHVARRMAEAENSGQPTLEPMSDANADRSLIASVRRVFADLKDGFSYTWRRANLRNVVLGDALVCFVAVAPMNLTLLLMTREYEGIDLNLGFINLTTASDKLAANELGWSIGMLLGGALMSTIGAKLIRNNMRVVAFGIALVGVSVVGLGVVHNLLAYLLIDVLNDRDVQTIIISPAKMEELKKSDMADRLLVHNIKLMTAPPLSEWNGQALSRTQLKEIQIEDLLQRNPIEIDIHKVASHLEGKRVMITGAAGSIGSEIMRQVASFNPYKLILVDQAETPLHDIRLELQDRWRDIDAETIIADISNATRMEDIFREFKPQYIFHAAAYKHVPMMEDNVSESIQVNVFGTRTVADLAVKYGAEKFVMISTDKAVNPTNVMGCSKRICEIYVQSLAKKLQKEGGHATQFITTRFGNVLGSNGSVIPRFRDQIQRGGPVTVTHPEIIRYFMTIPEACRLVLEAGSMGNGGEIYIFDMGKPVKIVDLAKRMISLSGRTDVKIEFTGLRHGEKLYEELLNVKELTKPTYHEKIMIATVREYDYDEVKERIQKLIDVSYTYDQMKIVAAMKDIVPEFVSKNTCFEALDKKK